MLYNNVCINNPKNLMKISFNDLFMAKILISKRSNTCQYIIEQFLEYSLPIIFKNNDFKILFMEESVNNAIKDDSEISSKLITNLEIILEKKIHDLINMFESLSIDELEENFESEIKGLNKDFSSLLSSKYASLADIFSTILFGSILLPKRELALEVREKIINEEICFNDALEKYSIGVEGKSKGIIGPMRFDEIPDWLISVLRETNLNFPSKILPLEIGFMIVQTFEINYPDLSCEEELNKIYRLLVKTFIGEISKKIEFGAISNKMEVYVS